MVPVANRHLALEVTMGEHGRHHGRSTVRALVAAAVALGALALVHAPPATAAQCDPVYGCTPTTPAPPPPTVCRLDTDAVVAGQIVNAFVSEAPANAVIEITFDGTVVGTGQASPAGEATIAFTVPAGIQPGEHAVFAVGAGFSADCGTVDSVEVLSGGGSNPDVEGGGAARSSGGRSLARTGIEIGLLLAIALVLLLAGDRLVRMARRRRRRAARRLNKVTELQPH